MSQSSFTKLSRLLSKQVILKSIFKLESWTVALRKIGESNKPEQSLTMKKTVLTPIWHLQHQVLFSRKYMLTNFQLRLITAVIKCGLIITGANHKNGRNSIKRERLMMHAENSSLTEMRVKFTIYWPKNYKKNWMKLNKKIKMLKRRFVIWMMKIICKSWIWFHSKIPAKARCQVSTIKFSSKIVNCLDQSRQPQEVWNSPQAEVLNHNGPN